MLKEERELRKWAKEYLHIYPERSKLLLKDITALVRAVREDAAKVAEEYCTIKHGGDPSKTWYDARTAERIAATIRAKGKK